MKSWLGHRQKFLNKVAEYSKNQVTREVHRAEFFHVKHERRGPYLRPKAWWYENSLRRGGWSKQICDIGKNSKEIQVNEIGLGGESQNWEEFH